MGEILFVLGMHRSGTSALTRVLSLCGAELPPDLVEPEGDNPTGFWEPRGAVELNDAFFATHHSSAYDPSLMLQLHDVRSADRALLESKIVEFLYPLRSLPLLLVKDPRLSLLLEYWINAARRLGLRAKAIHIFRDPYEVAASLQARQLMTPALALSLWINHNLVAERSSRGIPRTFVSYEDLLSDWRKLIARCAAELDIDLVVSPSSVDAVKEFLSTDRRHQRSNGDETIYSPSIEQIARSTLHLLQMARDGNADLAAFDREMALLLERSPFVAEEATRGGLSLAVGLRANVRRLEESIANSERRVSRAEDGAHETELMRVALELRILALASQAPNDG